MNSHDFQYIQKKSVLIVIILALTLVLIAASVIFAGQFNAIKSYQVTDEELITGFSKSLGNPIYNIGPAGSYNYTTRCINSNGKAGNLFYGPNIMLPKGEYVAIFYINITKDYDNQQIKFFVATHENIQINTIYDLDEVL